VGVRAALQTCVKLWLDPVLEIAAADIIVAMGAIARDVLKSRLGIPASCTKIWGPHTIAGCPRYIAFLPAPASGKQKTFLSCMPLEDIRTLRRFLREQEQKRRRVPVRDEQETPHPSVIERYLYLLDQPLGCEMIAYLAKRKGAHCMGRVGADAELGDALLHGSIFILNVQGTHDAAVTTFLQCYGGYLQNQEDYERGLHTGKAGKTFMGAYSAHVAPYNGPR
jgi:hypothetical protein